MVLDNERYKLTEVAHRIARILRIGLHIAEWMMGHRFILRLLSKYSNGLDCAG